MPGEIAVAAARGHAETLENEGVRTFLDVNAAEIPGVANRDTRKLLDDSIAELSAHAAMQNRETRAAAGALQRQRLKREALLRDHLAPIARIASVELPKVPELVALTLPRKRPSLQQLAALADGMADAAAPHADVFIARGRSIDFVAELKAEAAEMRDAAYGRRQSRVQVKESTTELRRKHSRARLVVQMLDSFIRSALAQKPGLLKGWLMAKRVDIARNGSSASTAAPGQSAAADTAAA